MEAVKEDASPPVRPRNRKEMILEVATEHFLHDGYHRTSMVDIAASIGITSTALYRHFRNKEELLAQCLMTAPHELAQVMADIDTLDQVIEFMAANAITIRGLPALWQREIRHLSPETQKAIWSDLQIAFRTTRDAVGQARPDLSSSAVELLAWCMLSTFASISHHGVVLPRDALEPLLASLAHRVAACELPAERIEAAHSHVEPVIATADQLEFASRRDRLLAAAARLFSESGYAAVGIDDIGAATGITGPSVYYHFARKSDLLAEIVDRAGEAAARSTRRTLAETEDPERQLELFLANYLDFAFTHRDLVWVAVAEVSHLPPHIAVIHRKRQREAVSCWTDALRRVRPELSDAEARVTVQAVLMIVNDVVRLPQPLDRPLLRDELFAIGMAVTLPARAPRPR